METTCFFVVRTDGSVDDVSYRKYAPPSTPICNQQCPGRGSCRLPRISASRCWISCLSICWLGLARQELL